MEEEAVKLYRNTFKLNVRLGFREDIEKTVTDLQLWQTVLSEWKQRKWSPFKINWMLSEYERRSQHIATNRRDGERSRNEKDMPLRISERGYGRVRYLRQGTRVHIRADSVSLEEIVATALRQANRIED